MQILRSILAPCAFAAAFCLVPARADAQLSAADSSARPPAPPPADSLRPAAPAIPLVGSIDRTLDSARVLDSGVLPFLEYRSLTDIISLLPGAFVRDPATPGLGTGLTLRGAGQQSIAVLSDGVLLNEPLTGTFNLTNYPTEQIERLEPIAGTRAFLYALNGSGGLVNIVSKSKKAVVPQSRIRYTESAHGYSLVDGSVSQDIIRGLNVTAGLQHTTYDRRFPNSNYDAWSARGKIRYNISSDVNVFASMLYNGSELGLNGGIAASTPDSLRFEELRATVVNADAYEKITRYDTHFGAAARPGFDTNAVHSIVFFHSTLLREYRDEENRPSSNGLFVAEDHRSEWYGVRWMQQRSVGSHSLDVGAEIASRAVIASPSTGVRSSTDKSVFGIATLRPGDELSVSGYARLEEYLAQTRFSFGGDAALRPAPGLEFFGGFSRSYRFPSFQEIGWNDSLVGSSGNTLPERHQLAEAGVRYGRGRDLRSEISIFRRTVSDAVILRYDAAAPTHYSFASRGTVTTTGISGDLSARISWLAVEARGQVLSGGSDIAAGVPNWQAQCGLYFYDRIIGGHLELKSGLRGSIRGGFAGESFDERRLLFLGGSGTRIGPSGTLDFLLIAHIGDAYIHLLWENLIDRRYVTTLFYPMPNRAIRFGLSWDFLN